VLSWLVALVSWAAPALAATGHVFVASFSEVPLGTPQAEPGALAVDRSTGRVFVADTHEGREAMVDVFGAGGRFETQFRGSALGIAVDEETDEVYVAEGGVVSVYKPNGQGGYVLLSQWSGAGTPGGAFGQATGVAFDNSRSGSDPHAGDVYVLDSGGAVLDVFNANPTETEKRRDSTFGARIAKG